VVGIGIGMSEDLASVAHEEGILDYVTFTVEAGGIGGVPAGGLSFGAVTNPDAIIDQPNQFDYYDGGGLDQGFLGAAEVDAEGNVNVSKFGTQFAGAGGFINISQNALNLYFLGSFTTKAEMEVGNGELKVVNEGSGKKFVERVEQITFSGEYARERSQVVYYITERCVFELVEEGLKLIEIAPGVDLQSDILDQMEFRPIVPDEVSTMDEALFREEPMGLAERRTIDLEKRFDYDQENNVLYLNLEGLSIETEEDVSELAVLLDQELASSDKKVHAIVNYANLYLDPGARESFFDMLRRNEEECFLSSTGYSVDTLLRRQLREEFAEAGLEQRIYCDFDEARESFEATDL
jgi:propionate CoA-transferase